MDEEETKPIHILHHHVKPEKPEGVSSREVVINGNVFSVYLYSNDDKETIGFLTDKALYILNKLREGDK